VEEEAPLARCRSETKIDEIIFYIEILFDAWDPREAVQFCPDLRPEGLNDTQKAVTPFFLVAPHSHLQWYVDQLNLKGNTCIFNIELVFFNAGLSVYF
jgi:hypothetical protein